MLISPQVSMRRRGVFAVGLAAVVASLALVACSSSGPSSAGGAGGSGGAGGTSASAGGTSAAAAAVTIEVRSGHLADAAGRTVYLRVSDTGSTSTCEAACATAWPPVLSSGAPLAGVGALVANLGTSMRTDGTTQVTYLGHPLYYFAGDKTSGQTAGQGINAFGGKWWELTAAGKAITAGSVAATPTSGAPKSAHSSKAAQPSSHPATSHSSSKPKAPATHSSSTPPPPASSSDSGGGGYGY